MFILYMILAVLVIMGVGFALSYIKKDDGYYFSVATLVVFFVAFVGIPIGYHYM